MDLETIIKGLRQEVDKYDLTVQALRALALEVLFDDSTRKVLAGTVHSGRKFLTSKANSISAETNVTPDMAVCRDERYGLIAEGKMAITKDPARFPELVERAARQVEKYDDDLEGWPNAKAGHIHDLVMLVYHPDGKRITKEIKKLIGSGAIKFSRKFAVISYGAFERAESTWPELELEYGELTDKDKSEKLELRIPIRPEHFLLVKEIALVDMYDHPPPVPRLMDIIHKVVLTNCTPSESSEFNVVGELKKKVELSQLQEWLAPHSFKRHDSRDPAGPKARSICEALEMLRWMKWVEISGKDFKTFDYVLKKGRRGMYSPLAKFIEMCAKYQIADHEKERRRLEREKVLAQKKEEKRKQKEKEVREKEYKDKPLLKLMETKPDE